MAEHIYCHIPFCEAKCPYCDFYSEAGRAGSVVAEVISRMIKEISSIRTDEEMQTVYIGGGTPSCIDPNLIVFLLNSIRKQVRIAAKAEITIEVNPSSLTLEKAFKYRSAGINRVSVGVQSLHDEHLKTLGRIHDSKKALTCIDMLHEAGFSNISADLIIAVPGQSIEDVTGDLHVLADLGVKHISTYSLSIEEGTPFERRYGDIIEELVPPEYERRMYHALRDELTALGYIPYEISNSAMPGYESRHNSSYWNGEQYYGIGPGAHGYIDGARYMHPENIREYISDPVSVITEEVLDREDRRREYPYLKLRTAEGVSISEYRARFGCDIREVCAEAVESSIREGLLEEADDHLRLTKEGIDWSNKVFARFL
ncbi:oxygen-independent coproporphyrinogen-3 oxidase [Ruminococcaceae bacterium YRB3002]|nr:oxygen-independent coproporphyrinogen-3 oxidase [Ruminococcaceae bacterium YRB3002]